MTMQLTTRLVLDTHNVMGMGHPFRKAALPAAPFHRITHQITCTAEMDNHAMPCTSHARRTPCALQHAGRFEPPGGLPDHAQYIAWQLWQSCATLTLIRRRSRRRAGGRRGGRVGRRTCRGRCLRRVEHVRRRDVVDAFFDVERLGDLPHVRILARILLRDVGPATEFLAARRTTNALVTRIGAGGRAWAQGLAVQCDAAHTTSLC